MAPKPKDDDYIDEEDDIDDYDNYEPSVCAIGTNVMICLGITILFLHIVSMIAVGLCYLNIVDTHTSVVCVDYHNIQQVVLK